MGVSARGRSQVSGGSQKRREPGCDRRGEGGRAVASSWQNESVAHHFLDERRAAIPYAGDQIALLLQLIAHFLHAPRRLLDLGCGDGLLARSVLTAYPEARAVLLDHAGPMLARAWKAMGPFG